MFRIENAIVMRLKRDKIGKNGVNTRLVSLIGILYSKRWKQSKHQICLCYNQNSRQRL